MVRDIAIFIQQSRTVIATDWITELCQQWL